MLTKQNSRQRSNLIIANAGKSPLEGKSKMKCGTDLACEFLRNLVAEYERALKFYSNSENWDNKAASTDKGAVAREALEHKD